jgi:hypothetical protein
VKETVPGVWQGLDPIHVGPNPRGLEASRLAAASWVPKERVGPIRWVCFDPIVDFRRVPAPLAGCGLLATLDGDVAQSPGEADLDGVEEDLQPPYFRLRQGEASRRRAASRCLAQWWYIICRA